MDRETFLSTASLEGATLEIWLEQRWLAPRQSSAGLVFTEVDVARVRLIHELQHNIGANDAGVDIILHLVDQLHGMRRTMGMMREAFGDSTKPGASPVDPGSKRGRKPPQRR